jgi:hypothetical protein
MVSSVRFPYIVTRNLKGEGMLRPQMPLTLMYRNESREAIGLLDTGADVNVLPYTLGLALGAVWEAQDTIVQLSGNLAQYEARGIVINATIGAFEPVRLVFAWTQAPNVPLLLGQVNFFAEFDVCFYRAQSVFEVWSRNN